MATTKDCPECKVLMGPTHSHASYCSRYTAPAAVPYGPDGFTRNAEGRIAGFAESNIAELLAIAIGDWLTAVVRPQPVPRVAAIGNGLFVRMGTGRKRRAA